MVDLRKIGTTRRAFGALKRLDEPCSLSELSPDEM
jgi:hypothetical protein